jgi:N-acetylmuramoyl-L-alanine amidase
MRYRVAVFCAVLSCGGQPSTHPDDSGPSIEAQQLEDARRLGDGNVPLPPRSEVVALEEEVTATAVREGAGLRAAQLYGVAARLEERLWRIEGNDGDALQALDLYRQASADAQLPGACELARSSAGLAGDHAHDASVTYVELYRLQRRFPDTQSTVEGVQACRRAADASLALLAGFRPAKAVLDAVDQALEGEGTLGTSPGDSGTTLQPGRPPQLVHIDVWPGDDAARVVISLDKPAGYRVGDDVLAGGSSGQTFVDLDGVDLGSTPREVRESGVVRRVHVEATNTGSRVLLDLDGHAWRRVFTMPEPFRVVIDVARKPPGGPTRGTREVSRAVLDPGHGGKDTGAVGPSGVVEKDVTLDIAHRAARVLVAQGIEVLLTRDDDRFVPLEERAARANAFSADLFVSIHCNASEGRGRRGVETYVLDATRDEIAARVAERENEMTPTASAELAQMLSGLRLVDQSRHSTQFARLLQRSATTAIQMRYGDAVEGGVHFAGFYVLVGARMPSALFETSYISNPVEEQRLGSPEYRQLLADAVVNAVRAYREGR